MYPNIPSSPTESALQQLVKGCKIAMHTNTVLAEENRQLRAENQRQKGKRAIKMSFIHVGGALTVQEGIERVESAEVGPIGGGVIHVWKPNRVLYQGVVYVDQLRIMLAHA